MSNGHILRQFPDTAGMANRFVALKVHRTAFDQALRIAGGTFLEVEPEPDAIAAALREEIVARQLRAQLHSA